MDLDTKISAIPDAKRTMVEVMGQESPSLNLKKHILAQQRLSGQMEKSAMQSKEYYTTGKP